MDTHVRSYDENVTGAMPNQPPEQVTLMSPVVVAVSALIGVTGLVGNAFVIFVMYKCKKQFRSLNSIYIINQSVVDLITSVIVLLQAIFPNDERFVHDFFWADLYCRLWLSHFLVLTVLLTSTYNLMLISVERYLAVVHPIYHRVSITQKKVRVSVVLVWLCGLVVIYPYTVPTSGMQDGQCMRVYFWPSHGALVALALLSFVINVVLPLLVHGFCYARILVALRVRVHARASTENTSVASVSGTVGGTSVRRPGHLSTEDRSAYFKAVRPTCSRSQVSPVSPSSPVAASSYLKQEDKHFKTRNNFIKMLAIVTVCYFVCWMPNKIANHLYLIGVFSHFGVVYHATVILVIANCCTNPIIYAAKYEAFRKSLNMLFSCRQAHR